MPSFSDLRKSISATLDEIEDAEGAFNAQHGGQITDIEDRMEARDIIARIERKMLARMTDSAEVA